MRVLVIAMVTLSVAACSERVSVVGSSGTTDCVSEPSSSHFMVECMRKACPAGLRVLAGANGANANVVQCLDAGL